MSDYVFWTMALFGALAYLFGLVFVGSNVMNTPQFGALLIARKKTALALILSFLIFWPVYILWFLIHQWRNKR